TNPGGGDLNAITTATGGTGGSSTSGANGLAGSARARSTGTAPSGNAAATAQSQGGVITSLSANAATEVHTSAAAAESRAAVAVAAPTIQQDGTQSVSFATGMPLPSDVASALSGNPRSTSAFNIGGSSTMLALAAISGGDT